MINKLPVVILRKQYKHQILSVSAVSLFQIYKNNVFHWTSLTHHQTPCQGHLTGNNISKHCEY